MPPTIINIRFGTDSDKTRFEDGIANAHGYDSNVANPSFDPDLPEGAGNPFKVPNPQSKSDFAIARLVAYAKRDIREAEERDVVNTARADHAAAYVEPDIS